MNDLEFFSYQGGDLSSTNPSQVFALRNSKAKRGEAFWVRSKNGQFNNYFAPFDIVLQDYRGLVFGENRGQYRVIIRNRTDKGLIVTLNHRQSESKPANPVGLQDYADGIKLMVRGEINPVDLTYDHSVLNIGDNHRVTLTASGKPGSSREIILGLDRTGLTGATGTPPRYGSLLEFTDSLGHAEVSVLVSATKSSNTGLWVGNAKIKEVRHDLDSTNSYGKVPNPFPLRLILHQGADSTGGLKLFQTIYHGVQDGAEQLTQTILTTSESDLHPGEIASARRISAVHLPLMKNDIPWDCVGQIIPDGDVEVTVSTKYNDHSSNPFLHTYSPDHDNIDARFENELGQGEESFEIIRFITLDLDPVPADFDSLTRLQRRVTGQYNEIITLVGAGTETKDYFTRGSFVLNRISSHPALGGDGIQTIDSPGADLGSANAYVPSFPQGNIGGKLFHSLVSAVENGASLKGNEYTKGDDNAKGGGVIAWNKYSSVDSAVFSHDLSSGDLTVLKAGDYLVSVIIPLESTNITAAQRNTHRAELLINGNAVPTAVGESSYIRLIEGHNESSNHFAVLVPLAANDKLTVKTTPTAKIGGESSIGTCSLYAELVEGDRNVFSASATEIQSGENLIAHWDFESGTKDSVYGLEGELLNGAVLAEMDDMNVLDLSGGGRATMKVATGDLLDLAATRDQVTVSFWQKFKSIGNTASFNGQSGSMSHSKGFGAHAPYGSGTMVWDTAGCCNGSTQRIYKANPGFDYKQWHHLAFVKDKGKKSIWIDGQLFHQGNNSAALPMDMSALWVGSTTNGNISINGAIDDFKVYAQALTGGQIAGQYSQGRDNVKGSVKLHDPGTNLNVKHDWKLIFRQTTPYYHSNDNNWATAKELNPGDPTNDNFSILNQLESFRGSDGKLHLKLIYPNLNPNSYQEWKQTSNPVTRTSGGVDGYEPIDEDWSFNDWGGLEYNGGPSLLDGSANHHYYYYGIGSKPFGTGFPGPSHAVNKVELYVMETPGTGDQNLVWTSTRQGSGYTHSDRDAGITLKDDGKLHGLCECPAQISFCFPV